MKIKLSLFVLTTMLFTMTACKQEDNDMKISDTSKEDARTTCMEMMKDPAMMSKMMDNMMMDCENPLCAE